ncbi:MAG TPA: PIG-L family deacetylase [Flavobacterium sp.]|uniref:PIG-L deacetylase family protein n=1 Tax=Flavobacterium sp. TaxID=239 RepID=UPI002BBDB9C6|nr:PIG-L family deacetylase [Flavobacterium sp.]HNP33361.1 PIG-L family deacetylase [Flavobacterium sp.]
MKHVFLSPHFDDAIGSCGGLIKRLTDAGACVEVQTIMSGISWTHIPKVLTRKIENIRACRALGAKYQDAGFMDAVFRKKFYPKKSIIFDGKPLREEKFIAAIADWLKKHVHPSDTIYAPSGLGNHVDHRIVCEAAKMLPNRIIFYEEFYYDWRDNESMEGYEKIDLSPSEISDKIRVFKKYRKEIRSLFRSEEKAEWYFSEFHPFEKYSEKPYVPQLIVTFTSFPARMPAIHKVVETILVNTKKPDRIVLYLAGSQFPNGIGEYKLHKEVEVRWTENDIRSYKKLVPALRDFPNDILITIDDDILYYPDLIERLLRCHKKYPDAVSAERCRRIRKDSTGNPLPYDKWRLYKLKRCILYGKYPKFRNMATTGGGTLFPPNILYQDAMREDLFTTLASTNDDLWFWAMTVLAGHKTAVAGPNRLLNEIEGSQEESLRSVNTSEKRQGLGLNDKAIAALMEHYPQLLETLRKVKEF